MPDIVEFNATTEVVAERPTKESKKDGRDGLLAMLMALMGSLDTMDKEGDVDEGKMETFKDRSEVIQADIEKIKLELQSLQGDIDEASLQEAQIKMQKLQQGFVKLGTVDNDIDVFSNTVVRFKASDMKALIAEIGRVISIDAKQNNIRQ